MPLGPNHTVPYGTGPFLHGYQAINCLATFIQSLRDKVRQSLRDKSSRPYGTKETDGHDVEIIPEAKAGFFSQSLGMCEYRRQRHISI